MGGACSGAEDYYCDVRAEGTVGVTASFAPGSGHVLEVHVKGLECFGVDDCAVIIVEPQSYWWWACGDDCSEKFHYGRKVVLRAKPDSVHFFDGWYAACAGKGDCILEMTEDRVVGAWILPNWCSGNVAVEGQADSSGLLTLMYAFRDQVLRGQPNLEWMVDAYYRHTGEVSARLISDGKLRARALKLLRRVRPNLEAAVAGGSLQLGPAAREAIARFALTLQEGVSEELVENLRRFRREIQP